MTKRRDFIKHASLGVAGASLLGSKQSIAALAGKKKITFAVLGCGGRAHGLVKGMGLIDNTKLLTICDVDKNRLKGFKKYCSETLGYEPATEGDYRKVLADKTIDAVFIATPEHWHAPMAISAMEAGKHVYVEKPCSHNLHENELLVKAQKKYNRHCQMGNQQRSSITSNKAVQDIKDGIIGEVYAAKAFYAAKRGPIGNGKEVAVPDHLDWELWQGPAPRQNYRDNVHPYNWHWFRDWGTGEIHNNGTHEIDVCRWALGVDYPTRVVSTGGRLHFHGDDWEYYDTQLANFEFEGGKVITWEGRSCNGFSPLGGRGAVIYGTKGSIHLNRGKYTILDIKGQQIKTEKESNQGTSGDTADTKGFDGLTVRHIQNLVNAIENNEELKAPIHDASISTHLCHLGNIAQTLKTNLDVDPKTGKVKNNKEALKMWKRDYEKGWEPKV